MNGLNLRDVEDLCANVGSYSYGNRSGLYETFVGRLGDFEVNIVDCHSPGAEIRVFYHGQPLGGSWVNCTGVDLGPVRSSAQRNRLAQRKAESERESDAVKTLRKLLAAQ